MALRKAVRVFDAISGWVARIQRDLNLKRMLVSGRDARDQLSDSSPKEGLGLDLYGA